MSADERTALMLPYAFTSETGQHVILLPKQLSEGYEPILASDDYASALTLDELLPYKDDPWWQNIRRTLFCSFWLIFLLMLITAMMLAFLQGGTNCKVVELTVSTTSSALLTDVMGKMGTVMAS